MQKRDEYLCEVSWEVCNKVGGIYTVITSKAHYIYPRIPNYLLIGPYHNERPVHEFVEELPPVELKEVFVEMKNMGLPCRYGKWLIKSEPKVVLIDFSQLYSQKNDIKSKLWNLYKIDSLNVGFDFDEPVVFSIAAAKLLDSIQRKTGKKVIGQFHEWMTGAALLWLKDVNKKIASIFTTHATVLGRAVVSQDSNFYNNIKNYDFNKEAFSHGVVGKHQIEKSSALMADVFTTVSEITALEAEYILGRKADVVLPNGIDLDSFSTLEELSIRHSELKHSMKDFISSFFFPYYAFDLDEVLILFIFGRYEYENKGIDIFIESLGKLNEKLKKEGSNKTIVTFFYIPADAYGINHQVLENKTNYNDLRAYIEKEKNIIIDKIVYNYSSGQKMLKDNIFEKSFVEHMQKKIYAFRKEGNPPYITHDLRYYDGDAIINGFKRAKLLNSKEDKVKVIFYPAYLKSNDNLLGLDIYDAMLAGHLGVFPSAYEPWGYTPLESAALAVASIASDLSGFGRYIKKKDPKENPGVFVLERFGKNKEEMVKKLFEILSYYTSLDKEGRIQNKIESRKIASMTDWKELIENYFAAYEKAAVKIP